MPTGWLLSPHATCRHPPAGKAHARQEHPSLSRSGCTHSQKRSRAPMGHPALHHRPGEASQPMLGSFPTASLANVPCQHLHVPVPCNANSAVPLSPVEGDKGCPGSHWCGSRLGAAGQQRQGWPAGGWEGCQHQRRDARISREGDPSRMIYRDFTAASVSARLICAHKISSRWFSGDPSCQG